MGDVRRSTQIRFGAEGARRRGEKELAELLEIIAEAVRATEGAPISMQEGNRWGPVIANALLVSRRTLGSGTPRERAGQRNQPRGKA